MVKDRHMIIIIIFTYLLFWYTVVLEEYKTYSIERLVDLLNLRAAGYVVRGEHFLEINHWNRI